MNFGSRTFVAALALTGLAACQSPGAQPAAPAAPANAGGLAAVEQVDLGAVTCAQALADEKLFNTAMLWADGYAHGRLGRPRTLGRELIDHKPELVTLCQRDTSRRLVEAVVQINRRPRR